MPRGRKKNTDKYWLYFDAKEYIKDLHTELREVAFKLRDELVDLLQRNVEQMHFSQAPAFTKDRGFDNPVTDYERAVSLLRSIVPERGLIDMANGVIQMAVSAMKNDFEDSHIGWYYEYGTGTQEDMDSPLYKLGDWNKFRGAPRPGAPIVTRGYKKAVSAHTRTSNGKAVAVGAYSRKAGNIDTTEWIDMAGVQRVSNSKVGGLPIKSPGYETKAYHWYRNAFLSIKENYFDDIKAAVFSVDPRDYLHVKPVIDIS
jgi:hypothetical protein